MSTVFQYFMSFFTSFLCIKFGLSLNSIWKDSYFSFCLTATKSWLSFLGFPTFLPVNQGAKGVKLMVYWYFFTIGNLISELTSFSVLLYWFTLHCDPLKIQQTLALFLGSTYLMHRSIEMTQKSELCCIVELNARL